MQTQKTKEDRRHFTVVDVKGVSSSEDHLGGEYKNIHPVDAAKKAGSRIYAAISKFRGKRPLRVTIKETTPGSKGKTYTYEVTRSPANKQVERAGTQIIFKHVISAKSLN